MAISIPVRFTYGIDSDVFPEAADVGLTNDLSKRMVWAFKDTAALEELGFVLPVPVPDLTGLTAAKFVLRFWTTATTGNHHWQVAYRAIAVGESMDPSTFQETDQPAAAAVDGTARDLDTLDFDITFANLAAGDQVVGHLGRRGNGSDTVAATLYVESLHLELS